jgi:hypothetical protein
VTIFPTAHVQSPAEICCVNDNWQTAMEDSTSSSDEPPDFKLRLDVANLHDCEPSWLILTAVIIFKTGSSAWGQTVAASLEIWIG